MNSGLLLTILFTSTINNVFLTEAQKPEPTKYAYGLMKMFLGDSDSQIGQNLCFIYPPDYYTLPTNPSKFYKLENATDVDPCNGDNGVIESKDDTILLMKSVSNCTLSDYVNHTKGHAGLLLISGRRVVNSNYSLDIIALITNSTSDEISNYWTKGSEPRIQVFSVDDDDSFFEPSILVLWLVACFCVAVGSLTGPYQDFQRNDLGFSTNSRQQILDSSDRPQEPKNLQMNFNVTLVLTLVIFISATLLLLYFFYSYLVYFFMAVFCIASGRATFEILTQILNICNLDHRMPRIKGWGLHQIVLAGICAALPLTWFLLRHDPHIWILQDLLGICFCIHLIQSLRIPSLKICTVLLTLLFFYDIFFVFITPFFTANGKSIMVEVATGGDSDESLPLLIKIPHLQSSLLSVCNSQGFSLLGFGDIIVPGFLVCFAHAFDVVRGDKCRPYFITAMIGYAMGLSLAFVALFITRTGQPALLYIVPVTLIPIYVVGICRKQVNELWRGTISVTEVEP